MGTTRFSLAGAALAVASALAGCNDWDPTVFCTGNLVPEVGAVEAYIVSGERPEDRLSTFALYRGTGRICTSVAINKRMLLTAAHCVKPHETGLFVRTHMASDVDYAIQGVYVHRGYEPVHRDQTFPNDVAILHTEEELPGPFPFDIYDPAAGGYDPDMRHYCTGFEVHGFGTTRGTGAPGLYSLPVEVGSVIDYTYLVSSSLTEGRLCGGDSGGPLYAFVDHPELGEQFFLFGLHHASFEREACDGNGVHLFLDLVAPWVYESRRCLDGGEDRLWDFYAAGYRGDTCEELWL